MAPCSHLHGTGRRVATVFRPPLSGRPHAPIGLGSEPWVTSASRLYVLTGAPGSGKTAILDRLSAEFRCVDEPAREVLAEQRASGGRGTWDQDPSLFVHLLLERSIEKYESARGSGETIIFDRGTPRLRRVRDPGRDGSCPEPDGRRCPPVSVTRALPRAVESHHATDDERIMSFEDTISFSESLRDVYERSGYTLVPVPPAQIDDRAAFVREFIGRCA